MKDKNTSCKFGSLFMCIFFHGKNSFPTIVKVLWDRKKLVTEKIDDFIEHLEKNYETILDGYFDEFKDLK